MVGTTMGDLASINNGESDIFLVGFDDNGESIYTEQFGSSKEDQAGYV